MYPDIINEARTAEIQSLWVQINTDNDAHQLDPIIRAKGD